MTYEKNNRSGGRETPSDRDAGSSSGISSRFASLTAGLLARKGEAKPAIEPYKHARLAPGSAREIERGEKHKLNRDANSHDAFSDQSQKHSEAAHSLPPHWELPHVDDGRWPPKEPAHQRSRISSVRSLDSRASDHRGEVDEEHHCPRRASARRAAVAVRMSTHDYLRLRLAAAELETSAHDIVMAALDAYLDEKGVERFDECLCLQKTADKCESIASSADGKEAGAEKA